MDELKTLTVDDLSLVLHRTVETIRADMRRRPDTIPPSIVIPGSKKTLWLESDVKEWLEKHRVVRHRIK